MTFLFACDVSYAFLSWVDQLLYDSTNFHCVPGDNIGTGDTEESDTMIDILTSEHSDHVPSFLLWVKFPQFLPILTQQDLILSLPTFLRYWLAWLNARGTVRYFLLECKVLGDRMMFVKF